jgi:hypothetical protein
MPETERQPGIVDDPMLPIPTEFRTVAAARHAVLSHDEGFLYNGALLADRMSWNPRVWSVLQTRTNGLIATHVDWKPGRNNRDGRRALAAWREDYPRMVSTGARKQRAWYGLMLGAAFLQRAPEWNPETGRVLYRLQPYWPGWAAWYHGRRTYQIQIYEGLPVDVPSPALGGKIDPTESPWYVYEPNGPYSWRWGLIHPLWYAWYVCDRAIRDGARFSEKHGIGVMLADIPDGSGEEYQAATDRFVGKLRTMGSEGVVPCKKGREGEGDQNVRPLEFTAGTGWQGIQDTRNACNVDIAVAGLGHNLTTEVKGGSFAAAGVGEYIRSDFKEHDARGEIAHDIEQLGRPWALANFGDPDLAPIAEAETDPPAADQAAATALSLIGQFLASAPEEIRARIDIDALFDRFRVALKDQGKAQSQVPQSTADAAPTNDTTAQPNDGSAPENATP